VVQHGCAEFPYSLSDDGAEEAQCH
jgi:hypothetical protein